MNHSAGFSRIWRDWLRPIVLVAAVIFPFRSVVADWNVVPSGSMRPTIVEGDRIFVDKLAYDLKLPFTTQHLAQWADPQRGDIVVFYAPDSGERLVKRVIGTPGDVVELRAERLSVNGRVATYRAANADTRHAGENIASEEIGGRRHPVTFLDGVPALHTFGPLRVPNGQYFMMGDSRDNSRDSRYFGFVPRAAIVGRATHVVVSLDPENLYLPRARRFLQPLP